MVASARAMQRRCCWPPDIPRALLFRRSFTSSHRAAFLRRILDDLVERRAVFDALQPRAEGDVVVNALGERIGLLEDQPDLAAKGDHVDARVVDVLLVDAIFAGHAAAGDQVVQPVDRAEKRALAAAARARSSR